MKKPRIAAILLLVFFTGCAAAAKVPETTQLQIRELQTRSFDTNNTKMVMKTMLNVLQDDGYIVKNADMELGLFNATKEVDVESGGEAFLSVLFFGQSARWKKNSIIETSANVSEFGEKIRVRINFQLKVLDNKGNVMVVKPITDEKYYQDFFSKVSKGIFIEKEKL